MTAARLSQQLLNVGAYLLRDRTRPVCEDAFYFVVCTLEYGRRRSPAAVKRDRIHNLLSPVEQIERTWSHHEMAPVISLYSPPGSDTV